MSSDNKRPLSGVSSVAKPPKRGRVTVLTPCSAVMTSACTSYYRLVMTNLIMFSAFFFQKRDKRIEGSEDKLERSFNDKIHKEHENINGRKLGGQPATCPDDRRGKQIPQQAHGPFVFHGDYPLFGVVADAKTEVTHQRQEKDKQSYADYIKMEIFESGSY